MVYPCICGPLPYFQGHHPSFHFSQPSLTSPARDAHPVSSSLRTGNGWSPRRHTYTHAHTRGGRKWSHCSTCNQDREQPQQGGWRTDRVRSHVYTNKCLTHIHSPTSPTAVGTGTTTQETECEQSAQTHKFSYSLLILSLFNFHAHIHKLF